MKITYQAPEITYIDVAVEQGFASSSLESGPDTGFEDGNETEGEW